MPFAPENELEAALQRAATDPLSRPRFYAMLMQSPLYVLGRVKDHSAANAVLTSLEEHYFDLMRITVEGRHYHPVFTAHSRIRAMSAEPLPCFQVHARALFARTRGAAFLMNFGSPVGKELLPKEIAMLLDAQSRQADGPKVTISQAKPHPGKLAGALGILFLNRLQVSAAHLAQAAIEGETVPRYLIGLVTEGDTSRLAAEMEEVAKAVKNKNPIDVMILDPANTGHELTMRLLAVPPFYARPIKPN
jgi:hypothetical protein